MGYETKFWADDPCVLVASVELLPTKEMSENEKLNALTRSVLAVTLAMYCIGYDHWLYFLIIGLAVTIVAKYYSKRKEGFSLPPTYTDGAVPMTTVPPLFAEEKQIPPPMYDIYNALPEDNPYSDEAAYSQEMYGTESYPIFGQYISDSTILPHEEEETKNRDLRDLTAYATDAFTRDTINHRNDMTRIFVNKINREYKGGSNYDQITPYTSW